MSVNQADGTGPAYGDEVRWQPEVPRFSITRLIVSLLIMGPALLIAAAILPGVEVPSLWAALAVAAVVGVLNAIIAPIVAAIRLPLTLVAGFLLILVADALIFLAASNVFPDEIHVDNFGWALLVALVTSAVAVALEVVLGANDDDTYTVRVINRIARKSGERVETDVPGIVYLEIDGLALPVLQRAMRDGNAPNMARWIEEGSHHLSEWETDLSSQTGASQSGILLGSNEDIPAFRWVEKETGTLMTCSAPPDCAELERRHATGIGLLRDGGASRGNLLSGEADHMILTVSRIDAEKRSNPGYRAFFANGYNVTRTLVLFVYEVGLELVAAGRSKRRDVRPRGHRGFVYALMRGAMCVVVRDLIVYGVLNDLMKGRPAVYATFSSYDEVAHHSGLERPDTLEALRKLDQQFGRIERARRYAPRPYVIVVLSDHGQTQGATFKQRNGYGLEDLVRRSLSGGSVTAIGGGDESQANVGNALGEATGGGGKKEKKAKNDVSGESVVVLGSGNLGLIYLMDEPRRLTKEEIDERHPELLDALRGHPHVGWLLVRSREHGALALGGAGTRYLETGQVDGEDPLAAFPSNAPRHLLRTDGFAHVADIMAGSFYDPDLEQGCAFEELISFHGGLGGPQTRAFVLAPVELQLPDEPIVGAAAVHGLLSGWRRTLQRTAASAATAAGDGSPAAAPATTETPAHR
ncbi:MAG: phage holin family protein [Gaiellaceae bacterium]